MTTRAHVHEEVFATTPERLFALLHTPSAIQRWWSAERAIVMPEAGGTWAATWGEDEDEPDYTTVATITAFEPPRRMVLDDYRYRAKGGPLPFEAAFVTEFVVEPHEDGALLRVTQDGFPCEPESDGFYAACQQGWADTFLGIREFLAAPPDGPRADELALRTEHLDLRPYAAEHMLALLDGEAAFAEAFGLPAAEGLRAFVVSDEVAPEWRAMLADAPPGADPWLFGFAAIERASRSVVGNLGFTGPPDEDGEVEFAYAVVPQRQGRGLATEMAAAAVVFALDDPRVRTLCAHTLAEAGASTRVLERNGFTRTDQLEDEDGRALWRWELARDAD